MPRIEHIIEIDARPDQVFAVLSTPRLMPYWSTFTLKNADDAPHGLLSMGEHFHQKVHVMGFDGDVEWEVKACDPPRRLELVATGPRGLCLEFVNRVYDTGRGTSEVIASLEYSLPYGRTGEALDRAVIERYAKSQHKRATQRFKELVEGIEDALRVKAA
jgi:hypothetical protein